MYIKSHESPRKLGKRNKKGASTPKIARRIKKKFKMLSKKLKEA